MLFDNDFIRLRLDLGTLDIPASQICDDWPPPEHFEFHGLLMERVTMSSITDQQRKTLKHIMRGAEYQVIGAHVRDGETVQ